MTMANKFPHLIESVQYSVVPMHKEPMSHLLFLITDDYASKLIPVLGDANYACRIGNSSCPWHTSPLVMEHGPILPDRRPFANGISDATFS
jgi:hypothetical protein